MSEANTTVDVHISNPTSSTGETWVEVRIADGASGMPLADFRMDPATWYRLLHGGQESNVPAYVTPHLDRIGKRREVKAAKPPEKWRWERGADPADIIADTPLPDGWPSYDHARVDRTNAGPRVVFMRWVETDGAA